MRYTVASLAGWYCFVLVFVTGYTGNALVLCDSLAMQFGSLLVAGSTHFIGCVGCIGYCGRHMGLVTTLAIGSAHVGTVWFVALCTLWNLAVDIMAEAASQFGVLAWYLFQLDNLLAVARQTLIGNVVGQLDDLGCMRIVVATLTISELVMSLVAMALTTQGNIVLHRRSMAGMTILASHVGFVLAAICGNIRRRIRVTFHTIAAAQCRFGRVCGNGHQCGHAHQHGCHT